MVSWGVPSTGPFQSALNQAYMWEGELWASGFLVYLVCEDHGSRAQDGTAPAGGEVAHKGELFLGA